MSVNSAMTAIADAIRSKTGEAGTLTLAQMATAIESIEAGRGSIPGVYIGKVQGSNGTTLAVTHGLGTKDIVMACCFAHNFDATNALPIKGLILSRFWYTIPYFATATVAGKSHVTVWDVTQRAAVDCPDNTMIISERLTRADKFIFQGNSNYTYSAGEYIVVIVAANAPGLEAT